MSGMVVRVVGAGQIGASHILSLNRNERVGTILVNDLNGAAQQKGIAYSPKARRDDPQTRADLTIIGTQAHQHWPASRRYLERGEPLYIEKPLSLDLDEARQFAAAERTGSWICVGQNMRFFPGPLAIKLVGDIGLRILTLHKYRLRGPRDPDPLYGANYYKTRGRFGYDGGVMAQQAQHLFDLACHLMGPARSVHAIGAHLEHAIECEDTSSAILDFGGPMATLHGTTAAQGKPFEWNDKLQRSAEVTIMTVAARDGNACVHDLNLDAFDWWSFPQSVPDIIGSPVYQLRYRALEAVAHGLPAPVTAASVMDGLLALHAAYRSMDSGRPEAPGEAHNRLGRPETQEAAA